MLSKGERRILFWAGVLILIGVLLVVNRHTVLSPWLWAAFLAIAGAGAVALHVADRFDGPMLLSAYLLWVIAGLIALVPSGYLRGGAVACYVLLAIAVPFLAIFCRNRARWWALVAAYALLVIAGVIALAESGLVSDDLVSAFFPLAAAIPFLVLYARDRKRRWVLVSGIILILIGLSLGSWLPWHSVRAVLSANVAVRYATAAFVLLVVAAWVVFRVFATRALSR